MDLIEAINDGLKKLEQEKAKDGFVPSVILREDEYRRILAELEKKDKIINEMSNHIATTDSNLCEYLDMTTKCKYYAGENKKTCDNCIKEYFKKKVEE